MANNQEGVGPAQSEPWPAAYPSLRANDLHPSLSASNYEPVQKGETGVRWEG